MFHQNFCLWDFNSITTHGYVKLSLLKAYITAHKIDIIYLSESYHDSAIQLYDDNLEIPGYNLTHSDHLQNNKCGGICIYYKALLSLRVINNCFLQECITFEVMIGDKQYNFVARYKSLSQNQGEFDSFSKKITLDKVALNNPFMLGVIGDLNSKLKN